MAKQRKKAKPPPPRKATNTPPCTVIAIGASAGGTHALSRLFSRLKKTGRACFIVIQHVEGAGQRLAVETLRSMTKLPVSVLTASGSLKAGHVYCVPPHMLVSFNNGKTKLSRASSTKQKLQVVDCAFQALAGEFGSDAVAVLLSGRGSDGAQGLSSVNEAGGLTMVQSPESAEHASMPQAALVTGAVDFSLPPEEMAREIEAHIEYRENLSSADARDLKERIESSLPTICDLLGKFTLLDFKHYKTSTLVRRIQRRMQVLHVESVETYIERLRARKAEAEALFNELLINVTSFFRDPEAFSALKSEVLAKLIDERSGPDKVRIWVAGCSTGEEAYTIAILCREILETLDNPPIVQILATDIDESALQIARKGSYRSTIQASVSPERLTKYFTKSGGRYQVKKPLRELCLFSIHNLVNDPPFSQIDLISCRNVLIYLGPHLQKKLFPVFHYSLRPGGYLFLGTSESLSAHRELFRPVNTKHRIAQRKTTAIRPQTSLPGTVPNYLAHFQDTKASEVDLGLIGQRIALDELAAKYLIVNDEGQIVSASAGISKYIDIGEGQFQNNVIKLVKPSLRAPLRAAFNSARKEKRKIVNEACAFKTETHVERVGLIVQPMPQLGEENGLYWIAFQYLGILLKQDAVLAPQSTEADAELLDQLERELVVLREDLDRSVQDLEASNEELKSSNEELLSMNEELQSANEELEVSKEEIQNANDALQRANSDLENLLASTRIATLFLSDDLTIRGFTPAMSELYNIQSADVGRPITDFSSRASIMPDFPRGEAVKEHEADEAEVAMPDGRIFLRRILPYRAHDSVREGVVVTFIDVTELRRKEESLRESSEQLQLALKAGQLGTFYWNMKNGDARWSDETYRLFNRDKLRDRVGIELFYESIHPEDRAHVRERLTNAIEKLEDFRAEFRTNPAIGEVRWLLERGQAVTDAQGKAQYMLGTIQDVTARRLAQIEFEKRVDESPAMLWITEADGRCTYLSKQWYEFTGQTPATGLGFGWLDAVHPDDRPEAGKLFMEATEKRIPFSADYRMRRVTGEYRWSIDAGNPRFDSEGNFLGFAGTVIDIHDRVEASELLKQSERTLDRIFKASPAFMCILRGPEFVYERANDAYLRWTGLDTRILGKRAIEVFPDAEIQGFMGKLRDVYRTGVPWVQNEVPVRITTEHGARDSFADLVYTRLPSEGAEPPAIVVQGFEVTEKVFARAAIERSKVAVENERENFRNLFKETPEMVCILKGPEHVFEFVNEAHARVLGFDATGMKVREAQPESVEVHGLLDGVYTTGRTAELREIPVTVGDRVRIFNLTYSARRDPEGNIDGVMILGTEVTSEVSRREELRRAKNDAERANLTKTVFLANMSHEIRTPLAAILGFSDLLRGTSGDPAAGAEYLDRLTRNAGQLGRLIDELLDLSKIEADRLEVDVKPVALANLVDDVMSTVSLRAQEKGLALEVKWSTSMPESVETDPLRYRQILVNVIGNAVKFTDTGSVTIDFGVESDEGKRQLVARIKDTGIGLTDEQRLRIFEPFMQGDSSVTRKFGGTGLGLALSKRLSVLLGGDIELVSSAPSKGSEFRIYIEIGDGRHAVPEPRLVAASAPGETLKGQRILVVDDAVDNRTIVSLFLRKVGAEVELANDGAEALLAVREKVFDLILMDIQMPVMDGYQALEKIKSIGIRTPIVALTAHAFKEERDRSIASGFSDYLSKPITRESLIDKVREVLSRTGH